MAIYYKGFDKDMKCRGFQYEEGKTYETDKASLCQEGFHACECPLDVFRYYSPTDAMGNIQKYHEVLLDEVSNGRDDSDTKVCAKKITIGAEFNFFGLAKAHIEWVKRQTDKNKNTASNTGNCSTASNTGYRSAASNTGDYSAASNTGYRSAASNTGNCSAASNTGNYSAASNTGDYSVALAWGINSKASAALGSYIVLAEYDDDGKFVRAKMGKIDGKRLKANTFYQLKDGKFIKAEE